MNVLSYIFRARPPFFSYKRRCLWLCLFFSIFALLYIFAFCILHFCRFSLLVVNKREALSVRLSVRPFVLLCVRVSVTRFKQKHFINAWFFLHSLIKNMPCKSILKISIDTVVIVYSGAAWNARDMLNDDLAVSVAHVQVQVLSCMHAVL